MASSRSGLFCAAFDCSNKRVYRKSGISSVFRKNNLWLFIEKRLTILGAPGLFKLNKVTIPDLNASPYTTNKKGSCQIMNVH